MTDGPANFYEVLGVAPDASHDSIRVAYRGLARNFHPDTPNAPADAEVRMAEINEAWWVVGDPGRRCDYDVAAAELAGTVEGWDPAEVAAPASPVEAIVPLASAIGLILSGLGFAGGAPGLTLFGVLLIAVAVVAFVLRRRRE